MSDGEDEGDCSGVDGGSRSDDDASVDDEAFDLEEFFLFQSENSQAIQQDVRALANEIQAAATALRNCGCDVNGLLQRLLRIDMCSDAPMHVLREAIAHKGDDAIAELESKAREEAERLLSEPWGEETQEDGEGVGEPPRGGDDNNAGCSYVGGWLEERRHGKEKINDAHWTGGKQHGKATMTVPSGEMCGWGAMKLCEGILMDGKHTPNADAQGNYAAPAAGRELPEGGRKLRSQRSQQRRLETAKKACEHCGVDDYLYKLRVCSGCNLALYCSAACQKAASRSHRRICTLVSMLPPSVRDSDGLTLAYDGDKMMDLDAGLRYATKYMDNLKHLLISLRGMGTCDALRLSDKHLCSLLRAKKGELESLFWDAGRVAHFPGDGSTVWNELHGLKQLRLRAPKIDDVQPLCDIIGQQMNSLVVLCLDYLDIDWSKAKTRRAMVQAVSSCKHLVKLDLRRFVPMDSDLKLMLSELPNLRVLNLSRDPTKIHEFTDNTCGIIARKCPGLQELCLDYHDHVSVRGVRKILEGCPHLRSLHTTTRKLSRTDVLSLLDVAPQLMYLSLVDKYFSAGELDEIVEATGGRIVLRLSTAHESAGISAETRKKYESQKGLLSNNIWSKASDPKVANEWEDYLAK